MIVTRKKLIEVALPLEAINREAAREKSIRHGHPSTLHLWWARRPLAAARAVIFAQMVDDPSSCPEEFPTDAAQVEERQRLFRIIEEMVLWENTTNEPVMRRARAEIKKSWQRTCADNKGHPHAKELFNPEKLPAFHDPFAGGGALPLEAQRLGLEAYASDLNPVAVLINKAMIEIPPKFANLPPINPEAQSKDLGTQTWRGSQGLADDIRHYGQWMRVEAEKRIGHLYPNIEITKVIAKDRPDLEPYIGRKLRVIVWLWARTVKSPNPAFNNTDVPLASTFMLSTKAGKESYVEPVILRTRDSDSKNDAGETHSVPGYRFTIKMGVPKNIEAVQSGTKMGRGANFRCIMSETVVAGDYIKTEGKAGRIGARLMAVIAEGNRGRVYLEPTEEHEAIAYKAKAKWKPDGNVPARLTGGTCVPYGMKEWGDLFTPRQLVALTTLSDLIQEAREQVMKDIQRLEIRSEYRSRDWNIEYANAVATYLGLAVSRTTNTINALAVWSQSREQSVNLFSRQAIPMSWDFPEVNPFGGAAGDFGATTTSLSKTIINIGIAQCPGKVLQANAQTQSISSGRVISTDPPYYDNVGYADLSDFFYVWLRKSLQTICPDLFTTIAVPKDEELVATPHRQGGKEKAEAFFLSGMTEAMKRLADQSHIAFPVTIYYAFKQTEKKEGHAGVSSTGWETFLDAVIDAGFSLQGTWPMRTERPTGVKTGGNFLASSIILVCRKRGNNAVTITRKDFIGYLRRELPTALQHLQQSNIAPVDLAQAAIGPGMAIYSRYGKVIESDGSRLSVRTALQLINQMLGETLNEQENDFDSHTRWAVTWFKQHGFDEGAFGTAEELAVAQAVSVQGLVDGGILYAKGGKARLLRNTEMEPNWDPESDTRISIWECTAHLVRALQDGGEKSAAPLLAAINRRSGLMPPAIKELAYLLFQTCEKNSWTKDALGYNALVASWSSIEVAAKEIPANSSSQLELM